MNLEQVRALAAIVDTGSFELAARSLHLTPSAVSQRVRALETSVGQVVVRRASPCTPTDAGAVLVRLARQVDLLEDESRDLLGVTRKAPVVLRVAVNADSLDTWLVHLIDAGSSWDDTRLNFTVVDEDHSLGLLREGAVGAAIATEPTQVPGCRSFPLGSMRYVAVASPGLAAQHTLPDGGLDWEHLPVLRYDDHDTLQESYLASRDVTAAFPPWQIPSVPALRTALVGGLGWLFVPDVSVGEDLAEGRLVTLTDEVVDIPLHWHVWKVPSHRLDRLNDAVVAAARTGLRAPGGTAPAPAGASSGGTAAAPAGASSEAPATVAGGAAGTVSGTPSGTPSGSVSGTPSGSTVGPTAMPARPLVDARRGM